MKPHDCESLNDFECWHVEHFRAQVDLWRRRNLGDVNCFSLTRADAQHRFPLEGDKAARVDGYIATRFQRYPLEPRPPDINLIP